MNKTLTLEEYFKFSTGQEIKDIEEYANYLHKAKVKNVIKDTHIQKRFGRNWADAKYYIKWFKQKLLKQ